MTHQSKYFLGRKVQPTVAPLTAAVSLALGATSLQAATITVNTLDDGSVAGQCTLRDAFEAANTDTAVAGCAAGSGADEIVFESGLSGTLTLSDDAIVAYSEISVVGPGADQLSIDGDGYFQLFGAATGAALSLSGLTLTNAYTNGIYGGAAVLGIYGASLALSDCVVSGNLASAPAVGGAGVSVIDSELSITGCSFENNLAGGGIRGGIYGLGAAVFGYSTTGFEISDSTFTYNEAAYSGGAIAVLAGDGITMTSLDLSGNEAFFGGSIALLEGSQGTLAESTVSGNEAAVGGGILVSSGSILDIDGSSIEGNAAYYDGGGVNAGIGYSGGVITGTDTSLGGGGSDLIYGRGDVFLSGSTVSGNTAGRFGGGMAVKYSGIDGGSYAEIVGSTLSGNSAGTPVRSPSRSSGQPSFDPAGGGGGGYVSGGGGMAVIYGGEAYIAYGSGLIGNQALQGGGLLVFDGLAGVFESLVDGNEAYYGGGIQAGLYGAMVSGDQQRGGGPGGGLAIIGGSTLSNNQAIAGGGALAFSGGSVALNESVLESNLAEIGGGLASYNGNSGIKYSQVADNVAYYYGGGVAAIGAGCDSTIVHTLVTGNNAELGGGVSTGDCASYIGYSTIADNQAVSGGGVVHYAGATQPEILNTTITGNTAEDVGGIFASALVADFITVSHNTSTGPGPGPVAGNPFRGGAPVGGALLLANNGDVSVDSSIFSDNIGPDGPLDLGMGGSGSLALDHSLVQEPGAGLPGGTGNLIGADPQLQPLADNGGPTPTRALAASSPAVDAGNPDTTVEFDQRGDPFIREFGGRADMGAFEMFVDGVFADRFEQP